jgi:hypothetical protein
MANKSIALLDDNRATRRTNRGDEFETIKRRGAELFNELRIKNFPFSFLQTNNLTLRFQHFTSDSS